MDIQTRQNETILNKYSSFIVLRLLLRHSLNKTNHLPEKQQNFIFTIQPTVTVLKRILIAIITQLPLLVSTKLVVVKKKLSVVFEFCRLMTSREKSMQHNRYDVVMLCYVMMPWSCWRYVYGIVCDDHVCSHESPHIKHWSHWNFQIDPYILIESIHHLV